MDNTSCKIPFPKASDQNKPCISLHKYVFYKGTIWHWEHPRQNCFRGCPPWVHQACNSKPVTVHFRAITFTCVSGCIEQRWLPLLSLTSWRRKVASAFQRIIFKRGNLLGFDHYHRNKWQQFEFGHIFLFPAIACWSKSDRIIGLRGRLVYHF